MCICVWSIDGFVSMPSVGLSSPNCSNADFYCPNVALTEVE